MPIPGVVLSSGKMLATQTSSMGGIELQTDGYLFGIVDSVFDGSDSLVAGDSFLFKQSDAIQLKYGSTIYYFLDVINIQGIVVPAAP